MSNPEVNHAPSPSLQQGEGVRPNSGSPLVTLKPSWGSAVAAIGFGLLGILLAGIFLPFLEGTDLLVGVAIALTFAAAMAFLAWHSRKGRLLIYPTGLVHLRGKRRRSILWAELYDVACTFRYEASLDALEKVRLCPREGKELLLMARWSPRSLFNAFISELLQAYQKGSLNALVLAAPEGGRGGLHATTLEATAACTEPDEEAAEECSEGSPWDIRKRGLVKVLLGAIGTAALFGALWFAFKVMGLRYVVFPILLLLPVALLLAGLFEAVTGITIGKLSRAWASLAGWQRLLAGLAVVGTCLFVVIPVIVLVIVCLFER